MTALFVVASSPRCHLCGSERAYWIKDPRGVPALSLCAACAARITEEFLGTGPSLSCPWHRVTDTVKKSWIYDEPPRYCGTCAEYEPDTGSCRRFPGKIECICSHCGTLILEAPGRHCGDCGSELLPLATPVDWQ